MKNLNNKYKCESVRLCRFLYSLGFDKESKFDENGKEYWLFERRKIYKNIKCSLINYILLKINNWSDVASLTECLEAKG